MSVGNCFLCRRSLDREVNGYIKFAGEKWHSECFRCGKCGDMLNGGKALVQKDKKPYHQVCYDKLFGKHCDECGKIIKGQYFQWKAATLHAQCFTCCVCMQSLATSKFFEHGGQVYCSNDYEKVFCPRCSSCDGVITGSYVATDTKKLHSKCFRCVTCKDSLGGKKFIEHSDGRNYCGECFVQNFNPRCLLCKRAVRDEYRKNFHGEVYCVEHEGSVPSCYDCERLVPKPNGNRYEDGRITCSECRSTAVFSAKKLRKIFKEVSDYFDGIGFGLGIRRLDPPMRTVSQQEMHKISSKHLGDVKPSGMTRKREKVVNGVVKSREIIEIVALDGMSEDHAQAVIAHEYGHVYLFLKEFGELPPVTEEGICEYFMYLWLKARVSSQAQVRIAQLRENKNEIYGRGFRECSAAVRAMGFRNVLVRVKETGKLP